MKDKLVISDVDWLRNDYVCDGLTVDGITYPSVEHAYQASKFSDKDLKMRIRDASCREARSIARSNTVLGDFYDKREFIMESLLRQKFTNNAELRRRLCETGNVDLVMEGYDNFWGAGSDGSGENNLGYYLSAVRSELQFLDGHSSQKQPSSSDVQSKEKEELLYDAIMDDPHHDLAKACQNLYDGFVALMGIVDTRDFDPNFIANQTGVTHEQAVDAVEKLRTAQGALADLTDFIDDLHYDDEYDEDDEDEDEDEEIDWDAEDDWDSPFNRLD